jgi:hypothetical protein
MGKHKIQAALMLPEASANTLCNNSFMNSFFKNTRTFRAIYCMIFRERARFSSVVLDVQRVDYPPSVSLTLCLEVLRAVLL